MIDVIKRFLIYQSYKVMNTNIEHIQLYIQEVEQEIKVVVMCEFIEGLEITKEQYESILLQIRKSFEKKGYQKIQLLSLICTKNVYRVSDFCIEGESVHWIIDLQNRKLIIYENQIEKFKELRNPIETIVVGQLHTINCEYNSKNNRSQQRKLRGDKATFTNVKQRIREAAFNKPIITVSLIVVNVVIFILMEIVGSTTDTQMLYDWGGSFYPSVVEKHEYYRLFTAMFLHAGFNHILNNMIVLALVGERLERAIGSIRYLSIYLISGIIANIGSIFVNMLENQNVVGVGASGAIFGIVGALAYYVVRYKGANIGISPGRLVLFIILSLYSGFQSYNTDNTAHIVGFFIGIIVAVIIDTFFSKRRARKRE